MPDVRELQERRVRRLSKLLSANGKRVGILTCPGGRARQPGIPADKDADRFFVYILLLNNGEYYIGQTREIRERLHEHRNNMSQSTRGREPKLQWFTTVETRNEATALEAELQQLNSDPTGCREISRWIVDFKELAGELDYTPHNAVGESTAHDRRPPYGGVAPRHSRRR